MVQGRNLKYVLNEALQAAAKDYLVSMVGQDLPENQVVIEEFQFEVQSLSKSSFMIRAKPRDGGSMSIYYEVIITGGG